MSEDRNFLGNLTSSARTNAALRRKLWGRQWERARLEAVFVSCNTLPAPAFQRNGVHIRPHVPHYSGTCAGVFSPACLFECSCLGRNKTHADSAPFAQSTVGGGGGGGTRGSVPAACTNSTPAASPYMIQARPWENLCTASPPRPFPLPKGHEPCRGKSAGQARGHSATAASHSLAGTRRV